MITAGSTATLHTIADQTVTVRRQKRADIVPGYVLIEFDNGDQMQASIDMLTITKHNARGAVVAQ